MARRYRKSRRVSQRQYRARKAKYEQYKARSLDPVSFREWNAPYRQTQFLKKEYKIYLERFNRNVVLQYGIDEYENLHLSMNNRGLEDNDDRSEI